MSLSRRDRTLARRWAFLVLLGVLLLATAACDRGAGEPEPDERRAAQAPAPVPVASVQPAPAPELTPAEPKECATAEACDAEASAHERAGHSERAAPLYARACDLGLGSACHRLGELHRDGKGVPADDDQARALFTRGCHQGSNAACDALGH